MSERTSHPWSLTRVRQLTQPVVKNVSHLGFPSPAAQGGNVHPAYRCCAQRQAAISGIRSARAPAHTSRLKLYVTVVVSWSWTEDTTRCLVVHAHDSDKSWDIAAHRKSENWAKSAPRRSPAASRTNNLRSLTTLKRHRAAPVGATRCAMSKGWRPPRFTSARHDRGATQEQVDPRFI